MTLSVNSKALTPYTTQFKNRAIDLVQVEQVKNGKMSIWHHVFDRLARYLIPFYGP
jgi:hypothetical protein